MKIRAICLIKNEADVVEECFTDALRWCDQIIAYDGASTDGTWETLQRIASDRIIPWRSDDAVFREGLRALAFDAFRAEARPGDWWCQLNADEFYVEDVRAFLDEIPRHEHVVWAVNVQYYLTEKDLARLGSDSDFRRDELRYYKAACAEPRFFRHRDGLVWRDSDAWPEHMGLIHPRLLSFRHYPYRSPAQVQMRLDVRRENRARGFEGWDHAKEATWQEKIVQSETLHFDAQNGPLIVEPEYQHGHRETPTRRLLKRVMHGIGAWA